jgi:hypothetical protein
VGRFVRVWIEENGTQWGASLWRVQVWGHEASASTVL